MDEVVKEILTRLKRKFDRVILFGSWAKDSARADSDVDLIVVDPSFRSRSAFERVSMVLSEVWDIVEAHNIDLDIITLTPEEFSEKAQSSANIVGYVLKRGEAVEA